MNKNLFAEPRIAYFSMEIAIDSSIPTYSGGLGVLAGDTIRSAADLQIPMAAVTLLYRKGYFFQKLTPDGWQTEEPDRWVVEDFLTEMTERTEVMIEGRPVSIRCWRYEVKGAGGLSIPVYFLDTDLPGNSEGDRAITDSLYGSDHYYRLCQEIVLGIGGVRMLRALGCHAVERFHMNEGHAALLTMELLKEKMDVEEKAQAGMEEIDAVRKQCIFTTHTPVPSGHDKFPLDLVDRVLGQSPLHDLPDIFCCEGLLNMTSLALNLSRYVNGVAKRHGEISRMMFAGYVIDAITNGVHAATWVSSHFTTLYDQHIAGWRLDNFSLRSALSIPRDEVWQAHRNAKKELIRYVNREKNAGMDVDIFTIGFARRAATYKRATLIFQDIERLKGLSGKAGKIQLIFAGKAHPKDLEGKDLIKQIFMARDALKEDIIVEYLSDYDMELGKMITSGVDLWLNTPHSPMEASGTSGMKAAVNGVPSLSILDGWWIEGCIEGITGWAIGEDGRSGIKGDDPVRDAELLYDKLEKVILPLFYNNRQGFIDVMRHTIALNGSFFNTHRMAQQYVLNAYFR